jgi:hypothetical protein
MMMEIMIMFITELTVLIIMYTRPVSKQQLSEHVPIARQQILNNAKVGL